MPVKTRTLPHYNQASSCQRAIAIKGKKRHKRADNTGFAQEQVCNFRTEEAFVKYIIKQENDEFDGAQFTMSQLLKR